jgi:hypothetical protein
VVIIILPDFACQPARSPRFIHEQICEDTVQQFERLDCRFRRQRLPASCGIVPLSIQKLCAKSDVVLNQIETQLTRIEF